MEEEKEITDEEVIEALDEFYAEKVKFFRGLTEDKTKST